MRTIRLPYLTIIAALVAVPWIALRVGPQAPPAAVAPPTALEPKTVTVVRTDESGNIIEEQITGYTTATQTRGGGPKYAPNQLIGANVANVPYATVPHVLDEESQKLFQNEKAVAAEAKALTTQLQQATTDEKRSEFKNELRQKLASVFDLQQQRREREVSQIEERLNKLKATMKKRSEAKDSIVDRRLESITGGIDELGWEETGTAPRGLTAQYGTGNYSQRPVWPAVPTTRPQTWSGPAAALPAKAPGAPPSLPSPAPVPSPAGIVPPTLTPGTVVPPIPAVAPQPPAAGQVPAAPIAPAPAAAPAPPALPAPADAPR